MGAENCVRYVAEAAALEPEAAALYILTKYKREMMQESYVFGALGWLLRKKPGEYMPDFPDWADFAGQKTRLKNKGNRKTYEEIMESILKKL